MHLNSMRVNCEKSIRIQQRMRTGKNINFEFPNCVLVGLFKTLCKVKRLGTLIVTCCTSVASYPDSLVQYYVMEVDYAT